MRWRDASFLSLSLIAIAVCAGLGFWQLERLEWKQALIGRMKQRLAAPTVPSWEAERRAQRGEDIEFLRVVATGHFVEGREVYRFMSRAGAVGWQVVAPFETVDGQTLLVDRGFVPETLKDPRTRPATGHEPAVTLTGIARTHAEGRPPFAAPDKPAEGIFFSWSVTEMADALALGRAPAFVLHAEPRPGDPGWPQALRPDPGAIPNNHLQYALTWFGLAGVFAAMTAFLLFRRRKDFTPSEPMP